MKKVADLWIDARVPRTQRQALAVLCDAQGRPFWVEGLREGDACRGNIACPATFRIRPEMKAFDGGLTSRRRPEFPSATMEPGPVPELDGEGAEIDRKSVV